MRLNSSTILDVKQHTIMQQSDTKTKPVLRVQLYVPTKDTSTVKTRTLSTTVLVLTAAATHGKPSTLACLSCQLTTLQSQAQVTVDHTDTTVSLPTTGTATSPDVTLTSICLTTLYSITSVPNTTVLIPRTVSTLVEWVTCT